MFESIVNFFKRLKKAEEKNVPSKDTAKERLHLVLMQDRANVSADFLELMKQEIIDVIKKYIDVEEEAIDVRLTNEIKEDGTTGAPSLYANIPIVNIKNEMKKEVEKENNEKKETNKEEQEKVEEIKQEENKKEKEPEEQKENKEEITNLEEDKKKLKEENLKYITIIKDMKTELKDSLNEKINFIKENDTLKEEKKKLLSNQQNLKNAIANTQELNEKLSKEKSDLSQQILNYDEIKTKYTELFDDYDAAIKENNELRTQLNEKKFTNEDLNKLQEKFETEIFNIKCETNVWKNNFLDIAKFKIINYNESNTKMESIIQIDKNYIQNAPTALKEKSNNIIAYFKHLIEQENYHSVNLRQIKENLLKEQELNSYLKDKLKNEKLLRRKIHNRYMFLRGNLRVMCRIRPFLQSEIINKQSQLETFYVSNETITVKDGRYLKNFEFDYIFDNKATQEDVYEEATLLIQSMLQGNNVCIIAYGQTCTGKTYTIQGPDINHPGVATRAAKELFEMAEDIKSHCSVRITLTIIEIYNEQIFNLLDESTPSLSMYENNSGNLIIPELSPIAISSFTEATKLFKLASRFRHTSSTEKNDRSSRSHCIFTFKVKIVDGNGQATRSTLNIIDLAGSERISKSKCEDELIKKEAICINLSLHALSTVLNSISIKAQHVPYRDSKLTHFLKESLNENYNILLLLHISPHVRDLGETISTLQFGSRIIKICKHKTGKEKIGLLNNNNEQKNELDAF